jgi:hypothetical protein
MQKRANRKNKKIINPKHNNWVYWVPRILSIAFILFLTIFSFDVFDSAPGFWQIVLALLMHNIPVFLLVIILIISWKYEIVGGVVFILAGLAYTIRTSVVGFMNHEFYMIFWALPIAGPAFLIGILFLICWKIRRKKLLKK